jgi:hypothetical protein
MAGGELIELEPEGVLQAASEIQRGAEEAYVKATRYGCAVFPGAPAAVEGAAMQMCSAIMLEAGTAQRDLQAQGEELGRRARLALGQEGCTITGPAGGPALVGSGAAAPSENWLMTWYRDHYISRHDIEDGRDRWRRGLLLWGEDDDPGEIFWGGTLAFAGPGFDKGFEKINRDPTDLSFSPNILSAEATLGLSGEYGHDFNDNVSVKVDGLVGARLEAALGAEFSQDKIDAGLMFGGTLGAETNFTARAGNETVGVEQTFGAIVGYAAFVDGGVKWKGGKLDVDLGAKVAVELGLSYHTHFSVNPSAVVGAVGDGLDNAGDFVGDVGSSITSRLPSLPW